MEKRRLLSPLILLFGAAVLLLHFIYFFYGHFGFDDLHYARLAAALSLGQWDATDHYAYRLTLLLPTALSYRLFGVSDGASALPPLAMSMAILLLLYKRHAGEPNILLLVFLLYFSFRWNLFYADKLMPDIYVSGFAFFAWHAYTCNGAKQASWRWPLFFSAALFLAFNAKGTIILLLPLLLLYFVYDLWRRQRLIFWQRAIMIGLVFLGGYLLLTKWWTGHFLARFRAIAAAAYSNACSYAEQDTAVLLHRLTKGFGQLLYQEGLWIPLALALLALLYLIFERIRRTNSLAEQTTAVLYFPLFTLLLLYGSANAMTISLTSYNPVCLDARHLLFVSPIAATCAASLLASFLRQFRQPWRSFSYWALALLLSWAAFSSLQLAMYSRSLNYAAVKSELQQFLAEPTLAGQSVASSPVLVNLADYLAGFPQQPSTRFYDIKQHLPASGDWLVRNWYSDWHSQIEEGFYFEQLEAAKLKRLPFPSSQTYQRLQIELLE